MIESPDTGDMGSARGGRNSSDDPGMTLAEYQRQAERTINPELDAGQRLIDAAMGAAEEAGELLGLVRKHFYRKKPLDRDRVIEELGDVLWCVTIAARTAGFSLDEIASANIEKLRRRYPDPG